MNTRQASGIRRVLSDLIELVELQFRLFAIDGKEAIRRALFAAVLVMAAGTLAISALTVLLVGVAWVLHETLEWPVGVSLLVVAACAIAVILAVLAGAYASLRRAASAMKASGAEFAENIIWFRETLRSDDSEADRPYSGAPEVSRRSGF